MAMTAAQKQDAYKFFIVSFGAITGVEYMNQINDAYNAGLTTKEIVNIYSTKPQFEAIYPRFLSNEQFADKLIENVVGASATAAAKTQAKADVVAAINAGWSKGDVVFQIFTNLSNKAADDADWGKTAAMLNNKVKVAEYYTETLLVNSLDLGALGSPLQSVTNDAASVEAAKGNGSLNNGQTFTLTTGVDNLSGTSGNDTFVGGTAQIQAADTINGGAGTDTAKLYLDTAGAGLNASNVEIFQIQSSLGGGAAFNATNVTGAEQIWSAGSTSALTVTGLKNNVTLGLDKTQSNLSANFVAGAIGAAETLKLATDASGLATGRVTVTVDDGGAASKFTTLDVNAVAGKSFIGITTHATAANATTDFTTLKTSGTGTVDLAPTTTAFNNLTTVELNAAGGSTVNLGANAKAVKVTGGAGNDTVIFAANEFNTQDVIDLGAGTNTLVLGDANLAGAATTELTKAINAAKGVSVLATSFTTAGAGGVEINAARYSAIDAFATTASIVRGTAAANGANANDAGTAGGAAVAMTGLAASGDSLNVQNNLTGQTGGNGNAGNGSVANGGAGGAGLSLRMALDSGADSFTLSVSENAATLTGGNGGAKNGAATDGAAGIGLDAREIESLSISVSKNLTVVSGKDGGNAAAAADTLVGANATVTITGNGDVNLGNVRANANDTAFQNLTIKAGDLVGALTLTTGAGNDVITVGSKGSTVAAGDGTDTITLGAGVDTVQFLAATNSGNVAGTTITTIDKVIGFKAGLGGDVLDNTLAAASFFNLTTANRDAIKNAGDLKAAADAAANFITTNTTWAAFEYSGKTYAIYETTGANTTYDGSGLLVELVGVTATDLVATNLI